ncbi:putative galactinol--sucrose galactosyltransferase 6 [Cyphellophora attinorum]|uniref:Putative galactinol--sucrose galactosyltransferase 6 n=1 Tax=Cyphellophora attinorum TaxID=1664694 RepID=A0A0N1HC93_9EURO|nr:putative galactinol--sucrose galactosyltransferase 6 [Phialophora attinorum]KPI42247.1 putative galactinol--sucrose galactosyltransferase 6 [Phialophora attinorum]
MALCPRVTTYPPLGKATVLPNASEVQITVIIEWERDRQYPFELELLYAEAATAGHPTSWKKQPVPSSGSPSIVLDPDGTYNTASFTGSFLLNELSPATSEDGSTHIVFTVQYRRDKFDAWKYVKAAQGIETGEFIVPVISSQDPSISESLSLENSWEACELDIAGGTQVWQLTSSEKIAKSQQDDTVLEEIVLGRINRQLRFMAITRIEPFWIGCEHDREHFYISNDGLLLSFLSTTGKCVTLLALNEADDVYTVFRSSSDGSIIVAGRNDGLAELPLQVLVAISPDKQASISAVLSQARQKVSKRPKFQAFIETAHAQSLSKPEISFFDNMGYCTWNGLGQDLTRARLLDGLKTLAAQGVKFNTLLIDDNWQSLGKTGLDFSEPGFRGWSRFEANEEGFPGGLGSVITEIKKRYPWIQYVGVWHALLGYWGGLSHDTEFTSNYKTRMVRAKLRLNTPGDVLIIDPDDIHRFYDDFYSFLRSSGVDFVKTDVQHMLGQLVDPKDRSEVPTAFQSAWTSAYLKHFEGRAISCMSEIPQILGHSFLQDKTPKILLRNSDDFFPEIPGSHPFHLFVNAHNALLTQHLNCIPDWDMFQTSHAYSSYHGAARAISGGPVLITDEPGSHDVALIDEMAALSPAGRRIAIRPGVATTVDMWDSFAAGQMLRIGASTASGAGILGLFNIADGVREALIPVHDLFAGAEAPGAILVRSYKTGQIFAPQTPLEKLVKVKCATRGWDVLTGYPLTKVGSRNVAILGLTNKISGAAAVTQLEVTDNVISLSVKALGRLSWYLEGDQSAPGKIIVDGKHELNIDTVSAEPAGNSGTLYAVDLEELWRTRDLWRDGLATIEVRIIL